MNNKILFIFIKFFPQEIRIKTIKLRFMKVRLGGRRVDFKNIDFNGRYI